MYSNVTSTTMWYQFLRAACNVVSRLPECKGGRKGFSGGSPRRSSQRGDTKICLCRSATGLINKQIWDLLLFFYFMLFFCIWTLFSDGSQIRKQKTIFCQFPWENPWKQQNISVTTTTTTTTTTIITATGNVHLPSMCTDVWHVIKCLSDFWCPFQAQKVNGLSATGHVINPVIWTSILW